YYNLQELNERMKPMLLRREKRNVIKQLPKIIQQDIFVNMHPMQQDYHAAYARGIAQIVGKKFITPYDMQKLMLLMANMRMVCDSTYLIDHDTNHSPKLDELEHILTEKMDLGNTARKIIIFSEWTRMNMLIGQLLKKHNIAFAELNGKVPVKHRKKLVEKFENDPNCKVFISTEAGGTGLNLQVADTVINFELPWNPAKKNQRIGRIDRVGQRSKQLTVLNFITKDSIEMRIASGLMLKQNLFEGVLDTDSLTDTVDFSGKGRSQFLQQLETMIDDFQEPTTEEIEVEESLAEELTQFGEEAPLGDQVQENVASAPKEAVKQEQKSTSSSAKTPKQQQLQEVEQVMNQGMGFLSGLFKMATGKDLGTEEASINVDKETGEVTMKFKLPNL
ncbi:MAG: DEAD/DEAH box helicase, partial [Flammeovirgaceae bacterium]